MNKGDRLEPINQTPQTPSFFHFRWLLLVTIKLLNKFPLLFIYFAWSSKQRTLGSAIHFILLSFDRTRDESDWSQFDLRIILLVIPPRLIYLHLLWRYLLFCCPFLLFKFKLFCHFFCSDDNIKFRCILFLRSILAIFIYFSFNTYHELDRKLIIFLWIPKRDKFNYSIVDTEISKQWICKWYRITHWFDFNSLSPLLTFKS